MQAPEPEVLPAMVDIADAHAHVIDAHGQIAELIGASNPIDVHEQMHAGDPTIEANGHVHLELTAPVPD